MHAEKCPVCGGEGKVERDGKLVKCNGCKKGRGWIEVSDNDNTFQFPKIPEIPDIPNIPFVPYVPPYDPWNVPSQPWDVPCFPYSPWYENTLTAITLTSTELPKEIDDDDEDTVIIHKK